MRKIVEHFHTRLHSGIAVAAALCVLLAGFMAVSPELHGKLHKDADHDDHQCLVTLITGGGMDHAVNVPLTVSVPEHVVVAVRALHSEWVQPLFLDGGVLEHGPPALN